MLVLKRRPGEGLTITAPDGTQVRFKMLQAWRIAVSAPAGWLITRDAIEAPPANGPTACGVTAGSAAREASAPGPLAPPGGAAR